MDDPDVDVMEPVMEAPMEGEEVPSFGGDEAAPVEGEEVPPVEGEGLPPEEPLPPPVEEEFIEGVVEDGFGDILDPDGLIRPVKRFTFTNKHGMTAQVINYGITVVAIRVADRKGVFDDVVLGFDKFDDYIRYKEAYIGSTIGRVCNRVSRGKFMLGSRVFDLTKNVQSSWHLHGGDIGLSFMLWKTHIDGKRVVFSYLSPDGEEGYPGNILLQVIVWLTDDNGLKIVSTATADSPTPINLTNHTYFNLGGHWSGAKGVGEHVVIMNADKYLDCDDNMVPTGEIKRVGIPDYFDLRIPKLLSRLIPVVPMGGYDINYRINGGKEDGVRFVGRLIHPPTGRVMEVFSNQLCAVFFTARNLPGPDDVEEIPPSELDYMSGERSFNSQEIGDEEWRPQEISDEELRSQEIGGEEPRPPPTRKKEMIGKSGIAYEKYGGICIEPQAYPDAVNKPHFPPVIIYPGQTYKNVIVYKFSTLVRTKSIRVEATENSPEEVVPPSEPSVGSGDRSRHSGDSRASNRSPDRMYSGEAPTLNYSNEDQPGREQSYQEPEREQSYQEPQPDDDDYY